MTIRRTGARSPQGGKLPRFFRDSVERDPLYQSVVLLCGFNGANDSTTFTDEGPLGLTLTAQNDAKISTSQAFFGGSSLLLDGASAVRLPTSTALVLGDFTIEAKMRCASSGKLSVIGGRSGYNSQVSRESNTTLGAFVIDNLIEKSFASPNDAWLSPAWSRKGSTVYLFGEGKLLGTGTESRAFDFSAGEIGRIQYSAAPFDGFIDELRITSYCRMTSDYLVNPNPFPRS